jgi:hypothetical protein
MKIFDEFNEDGICPICKTSNKGKSILIKIDGSEVGKNVKATNVHLDCLDLSVIEIQGVKFIYQRI